MEGNRWEEGQCVVPCRGVENTVNLKLIHHHHGRVMRKNVKASENAKLPKGVTKGVANPWGNQIEFQVQKECTVNSKQEKISKKIAK